MSPSKWLSLLLAAALLTACLPAATSTRLDAPWQRADLRILESPNQPDPNFDLVAAYARLTAADLEIRFDLLGSPDPFGYDFYVAIDAGPEGGGPLPLLPNPGIAWDIALGFPALGLPRTFSPAGDAPPIRPRIHRDSVLDAVTIRLNRKELTGDLKKYQVIAWLVKPGEQTPADSIGPLLVGGPAPTAEAPVSLAFWDAFPSATPAQALRRWSGAHTGPYGQRHGLSILLAEAARSGIPIALLDLKRPEQLSALEAVGGMPTIQKLSKDNLLLLPDYAFGDQQVAQTTQQISRVAAQRFQLPASPFLYDPGDLSVPGQEFATATRAVFTHLQDRSHIVAWNNLRLIPLPIYTPEDPPVDLEGPNTATRLALLQAALSPDTADLIVFGGDLPNSPWADSSIAAPALRYFSGHPWIHVLDAKDLLQFPTVADTPIFISAPECSAAPCPPAAAHPRQAEILQTLRSSPPGLFQDLAWQAYLRLTEPTTDTRLEELRAGYTGQVGLLLAAARWNAAPREQSTCAEDLNWDGTPDCILASKNIFLVLNPIGGSLAFAAARDGAQPLQWLGPRSQFVVGLGDSFDWRPERGLAGDPQEIPGAFADPPDLWQRYRAETTPDTLIFTHPENSTRKVFRLTETGVHVSVENQPPGPVQISLALIDLRTFEPGSFSKYNITVQPSTSGAYTAIWEIDSAASLVTTVQGAAVQPATFADSRSLLISAEDPNTGYPPGHFVPFPLAIFELQPQGNYSVEFRLEFH